MEVKNIINFLKWTSRWRHDGMPVQYFNNQNYITWFLKHRPSLKQYHNIHNGQDCFIIGNGPSLNATNLDLLKDYYVFGLNKIHLIFEKYHQFQLSYHVTVNPLVIQQIQHELNNNVFKCPSFLSYHASEGIEFTNSKIHKLHTKNAWSFYKDIAQPIHEGYTVTYVAMQIAYYMGFKNVFLLGVDHNYQQKGRPNEQQEFKGDDVNHFHPDYFKGMQWHLADMEGNEASYALARHQFHGAGRNIYDATINGKLTIFEKLSFDNALKLARKK